MTDTSIYDLGHAETQIGTPDPTLLVMLVEPTDPSAPLLRTLANLALDLRTTPLVPAWTSGQAWKAGELARHLNRVYMAVTDLGVSTTLPALSPHWVDVDSQGNFRGTWWSGNTYYRGDIVYHDSGHFFICVVAEGSSVQSNSGPVADVANWDPVGVYRDAWDATQRYAAGDMVTHGGHLWAAVGTVTAGDANAPGSHGNWRRIDNDPFPQITSGFSGADYEVRFGTGTSPSSHGAFSVPAATIGAQPSATRGGLITAAMANQLQAAHAAVANLTARVEALEGRSVYRMDPDAIRGDWATGLEVSEGDIMRDHSAWWIATAAHTTAAANRAGISDAPWRAFP